MRQEDPVLADLDRLIGETAPEERPGLVVALAARMAALGASLALPRATAGESTAVNLSAEEAARRLGVSRDWLYKTALPFKVRIGRRVLFSAIGLDRWNRQRAGR